MRRGSSPLLGRLGSLVPFALPGEPWQPGTGDGTLFEGWAVLYIVGCEKEDTSGPDPSELLWLAG